MAAHSTQSAVSRIPAKNPTADKLLVAAGELMIERNSVEISLADIAQKSGVNAALVKYHFGNKDGLLLALLERDAATGLPLKAMAAAYVANLRVASAAAKGELAAASGSLPNVEPTPPTSELPAAKRQKK